VKKRAMMLKKKREEAIRLARAKAEK